MMRSSKVKLNIMINRAGLLLINIYINDVRHRIAGVAVHSGEMSAYHALPTLTKDEAWSIFHRAGNNGPIRSIPTCRTIPYTTWDASTCSV